jgi:hypothetical protein
MNGVLTIMIFIVETVRDFKFARIEWVVCLTRILPILPGLHKGTIMAKSEANV